MRKVQGLSVATVIVLYNPGESVFDFILSLRAAGKNVVAVANAATAALIERLEGLDLFGFVSNCRNEGLAVALNQGLQTAFANGATHVLLLDQDSRPFPEMGDRLVEIHSALETAGEKIGCLGPQLVDVKRPIARLLNAPSGAKALDLPSIATSGSLISSHAYEAVGPMWDELFIDAIDHEWCFRARSLGYRICVCPEVSMPHDMGDLGISILGRYKPVHRSPIRHYHIVRNALWLARRGYIPFGWRMSELVKLLYRMPVYLIASTNRTETLRALARAVAHGVSGHAPDHQQR